MKVIASIFLALFLFGCGSSDNNLDYVSSDSGGILPSHDIIIPSHDIVYMGAFKVPSEISGQKTTFGQNAMSYNPTGNEGEGSLFINAQNGGYDNYGMICEITIPPLIIPNPKGDGSDLNTAEALQNCQDIFGFSEKDADAEEEHDILYMSAQSPQISDKLFLVRNVWYSPAENLKTIGWAETDLLNPNTKGWWHVGDLPAGRTSNYIFEINRKWSDAYVGGRYIGIGRSRINGGDSFGPTLYAIAPWKDGNPPIDDAKLTYSELLFYPRLHELEGYSLGQTDFGAAWVTVGSKAALMFYHQNRFRHMWNRNITERSIQGYGLKVYYDRGEGNYAYHGQPMYPEINMYDVNDIAAVAQGKMEPWEPQPYVRFNFNNVAFLDSRQIKQPGMAYDSQNNRLFVGEAGAISNGQTVIHVFSIQDNGSTLDITPPSTPTGLSWNPETHTLSWTASVDDRSSTLSYIIYRTIPPKVGIFPYGKPLCYTGDDNGVCGCEATPVNFEVINPYGYETNEYPYITNLVDSGTIYRGDDNYYHYSADDSIFYMDYPMDLVSGDTQWIDPEWDFIELPCSVTGIYGTTTHHEFKVQAMDNNSNLSAKSESVK